MCGDGIAQFANDAIHVELTGAVNNARFEEREDGDVYLVADTDIQQGQEVLVEYHISYWLGMVRHDRPCQLPCNILDWCRAHVEIEDALQSTDDIICIESYVGLDIVDVDWLAHTGGIDNCPASMCDDAQVETMIMGVATYTVKTRTSVRRCHVLLIRQDSLHNNTMHTLVAWRWNAKESFQYLRTVLT